MNMNRKSATDVSRTGNGKPKQPMFRWKKVFFKEGAGERKGTKRREEGGIGGRGLEWQMRRGRGGVARDVQDSLS